MVKKISKKTNKISTKKDKIKNRDKPKHKTKPKANIEKLEIKTITVKKQEMTGLLEKGWLRTNIIIEILGAPKEHVEHTIKKITSLISNVNSKTIKLLNYDFEKAENVGKTTDGKTELFSSFAELEIMFNALETLTEFCFVYMPSSIEIIDPVSIKLNNKDLSGIFNDLQAKLHAVDKVAKELRSENRVLRRNAGLLLRNNILITMKDGKEHNIETLSKLTGVPANQLESFLEGLVKEGFIKKNKREYVRIK